MPRVSIAGLLTFVAFTALGFAALRAPSPLLSGASFTLTLGILSFGLVGTCLRGRRNGAWLGFTVFGGIFFLSNQVDSLIRSFPLIEESTSRPLANRFLSEIFPMLHSAPLPPLVSENPGRPRTEAEVAEWESYRDEIRAYPRRQNAFMGIGNDFSCILMAYLGAVIGAMLGRNAPQADTRG